MFNLINDQPDISKISLYAKDALEAKYQLLIKKSGSTGLKHVNDSKDFIEFSNDMGDIYKNIEEYYRNKKHKIMIVFDDVTVHLLSNKKLNPIVKNYLSEEKTKHFSCFYHTILFAVPNNIGLNSTHCFIMKNLNKQELPQNAFD